MLTTSLVIIFISKLIQVYKSIKYEGNQFLIKPITKITILSSISISITFISILLFATFITIKSQNLFIEIAGSWIGLLDLYTNFLCVIICYGPFKMYYMVLCKCVDKRCFRCWSYMITNKNNQQSESELECNVSTDENQYVQKREKPENNKQHIVINKHLNNDRNINNNTTPITPMTATPMTVTPMTNTESNINKHITFSSEIIDMKNFTMVMDANDAEDNVSKFNHDINAFVSTDNEGDNEEELANYVMGTIKEENHNQNSSIPPIGSPQWLVCNSISTINSNRDRGLSNSVIRTIADVTAVTPTTNNSVASVSSVDGK